tara:strand:- start:358 stop:663 length:306 start_codon:yes stop_codon:yes gene_type:complete
MQKIPKHVEIIGHKYSVVISTEMSEDELGRCDYNNQKILISKYQASDTMRDTFLHEIIHAVHWLMGLGDNSTEEEFTARTTTGLRSVMLQNPEVVNYLLGR